MSVNNLYLVVISSLLVLCNGLPWIKDSHRSSSQDLGIISPGYTDIANYSYTVALLVDLDLLGGGALIKQNWVLTAASVMRGFSPKEIKVRVGSNSPYDGGRLCSVSSTIIHPLYATNNSYNLALLKLKYAVSPKVATKVPYLARIPFIDNGTPGNTTGYGTNSGSKININRGLEIAQGLVYTSSYCEKHWGRNVSRLHICGYSYYTVPCYGDEGDPLTRCVNGTKCELLGIATGIDQCDSYEPYTFVDVGQFSTWIRQSINESSTNDFIVQNYM